MKKWERNTDWNKLRSEWQVRASVNAGNLFKALERRGKYSNNKKGSRVQRWWSSFHRNIDYMCLNACGKGAVE